MLRFTISVWEKSTRPWVHAFDRLALYAGCLRAISTVYLVFACCGVVVARFMSERFPVTSGKAGIVSHPDHIHSTGGTSGRRVFASGHGMASCASTVLGHTVLARDREHVYGWREPCEWWETREDISSMLAFDTDHPIQSKA